MIYTDGISCSILFIKNDTNKKRKIKEIPIKEKYISEIDEKEREKERERTGARCTPWWGPMIQCESAAWGSGD